MSEKFERDGRVFEVAAEHGKRRSSQHVLTLVEDPTSPDPLVFSLRPTELELAGFTPVVDEQLGERAA